MITNLLLVVALLGSLTSFAFFLLVVTAVVRKRLVPNTMQSGFRPPVSVLKPVHGMEPCLEESLESFFQQDYPDYELIFCARQAYDPALLLAERLSLKYPNIKVKILTCGEPKWPNAKVYS